MTYIVVRKNAAGEVTSYQVKWHLGGDRKNQRTERFDDPDSAEVFRRAVDEAEQQWRAGWVKGRGFNNPAAEQPDEQRYRFENYARKSIRNRTGVEPRYRDAILKELETYVLPTFGHCDVRSTEHFCKATVSAWVNQLSETLVWRGAKQKAMAPKTIRNLHGLCPASCARRRARSRRCVRGTRASSPGCRAWTMTERTRATTAGSTWSFLTPAEVEGIAVSMPTEESGQLVRDKYALGARYGEMSALARRHIVTPDQRPDRKPRLKIVRAWKWSKERGWYLGKPKWSRHWPHWRPQAELPWSTRLRERAEGPEGAYRLAGRATGNSRTLDHLWYLHGEAMGYEGWWKEKAEQHYRRLVDAGDTGPWP